MHSPQVLKNFFELWFWDSKPNLVRRLMRLLLTRQLLQLVHPCGRTYGEVGPAPWLLLLVLLMLPLHGRAQHSALDCPLRYSTCLGSSGAHLVLSSTPAPANNLVPPHNLLLLALLPLLLTGVL
jgi:hypothetical protein